MQQPNRFQGTLTYIYAYWPYYAWGYAGVVLALLVIGISAEQGWYGYIPLTLAVVLILCYFLSMGVWSAFQLFDRQGTRPHQVLFDMAELGNSDRFVFLDLGWQQRVMELAAPLVSGQVQVVDVYNPQWTESGALTRFRQRLRHFPEDPRIDWKAGQVNMLPFPDDSVQTVMGCQIFSAFWQEGDRLALLREVKRVMGRNGRFLFAERARTPTNWAAMGPFALNLPTVADWKRLLNEAGLQVRQEKSVGGGLIHCFVVTRQTTSEARQLTFNL